MNEQAVEDERIVAEDPDFPPPGAARGPAELSRFTLHMVGHAHIDLGYRWNQAETVHYVAPWTFRGVLELMERTPGFTFCQSQLYLYEAMRREYPALMERIRAAIAQGSWEVVGGAWCEYDAILPGGEAVIRQHLHGVRYAVEQLGVDEHRVAFVPDSFCGHPATLPQLLAGCGFEYYIFGRGLPQDPAAPQATRRAFRWVGPDGSSLVAYLPFGPYATPPITPAYLDNYLPYAAASVSPEELVLYGQGDHGGGPRDPEIEALRALAQQPQAPHWHFSSVHACCDAAFDPATVQGLAAHHGNLGGFATGALTSQAQIKRRNRRLEKLLVEAEATAVIGALLSRKPAFPRQEVKQLWRRLLTEQFHDILPGTSVASVYRDTMAAYDEVEQGAGWLLADGFARLCSRLDTRGDGVCVVAYNPGLAPLCGPFEVRLPDWLQPSAGDGQLLDSAGAAVLCHREDDRLIFGGRLPSLGYRTFRWVQGAAAASQTPVVGGMADGMLDTPRYRLRLDMATGDLVALEHKPTGRQLLAGSSNVLQLYDELGIATAWVQALAGAAAAPQVVKPPQVVEANPLYTRLATTSRSQCSSFRREITVYADQDRVDFRLTLDWHEGNACLKLGFAPAMKDPVVRAALAHGSVAVDEPQREFCCHEFVELHDGERGMALLDDGAYGCSFAEGVLRRSAIRTVRDMDPRMAHGPHELRYALYPYAGKVADAELLAQTASLERRALCACEPPHPGGIKTWGAFDNSRPLPPAHRLVGVDCEQVALCAFKLLEEDWAPLSFVVRVRETAGQEVDCWVELPVPVSRAVAADHLERVRDERLEVDGRRVLVRLAPFALRTLVATV